MTRRREQEERLALYGDLAAILNAMRSFALAELRRVMKRETVQQQATAILTDTLAAMIEALPHPEPVTGDIWILLGSTRGFCASFNEDVLREWQAHREKIVSTIVVGERLGALLPEPDECILVPGALNAADALGVINRILSTVEAVRASHRHPVGLVICFRDEQGAAIRRLLPFAVERATPTHTMPKTLEPPEKVARNVAEHTLFHLLLSILLRSLRMENHLRLMQMENALRHIDSQTEELQRKQNQLRQEEVTEEIELLQNSGARIAQTQQSARFKL